MGKRQGARVVLATLLLVASGPGVAAQQATAAGPRACTGRLCAGAAKSDITPPVTTPMWGFNSRWFLNGGQLPSQQEPTGRPPTRWFNQRTQGVDTDVYRKGLFLGNEGIQTRLYARALDIRNAEGAELVLVQVDLGAMTGEMWRGVAQRIAPLGISRDHLLISATHTHGGPGAIQQPPGHALLVGDNYDPRVVKRTIDGIVKAITLAHQRLAPAKVAVGQTPMLGVSANRSFTPHLGDPCPDPAAINDGTDCDQKTPFGSHAVDPLLTMIRADRTDGVPLGVWTSFAIHGTVMGGDNLLFTGDNQGFAERLVEQGIAQRAAARGVNLPAEWQVVDADANGSEGDIAPFVAPCDDAKDFDPKGQIGPYACFNDFAAAEWNGIQQAQMTLRLYDQLGGQMVSDLPLDARLDVLYMTGANGTSPVAVFGEGSDCTTGLYGSPGKPNPPFGQAPFNQGPFYGGTIPGQGRKCPFLVLTGLGPPYFWVQAMKIGDYVLANMPGEMTVEMARRVRQHILQCPIDCDAAGHQIVHHAVLVGLANDYMSYVTTPEEYDYQWYEGTFTLWGPQEGPFLLDRFGMLVDAMLHGRQVTFRDPPDTSGTQADNVSPLTEALSNAPLTPPPGTVLTSPPVAVKRGQVVDFSWVGGQPSAEVVQDQPLVTTECRPQGAWKPAFSDESVDDITDYARDGVTDHWGSRWDVTLDAPTGNYRFAVTGQAYVGGQIKAYAVNSKSFTVLPSDGLAVIAAAPSAAGTLVRAAYPKADPNTNFRLRPTAVTSGTITITVHHVDGTTATSTGGYQAALDSYAVPVASHPGDTVTVAAGGLVDAVDNTNGAPQSLTVSSTLPATFSTGLTIPPAPGLPTASVVQTCGSAQAAPVGHIDTPAAASTSPASGSVLAPPNTSPSAGMAGRLAKASASNRAWPWLVVPILVLGIGAYVRARGRRYRRGASR